MDLVHMMEDSLISSDQILAHQSPTVRKFLGKQGFLCRAYTGPKWAWYTAAIFSARVFAFLLHEKTQPENNGKKKHVKGEKENKTRLWYNRVPLSISRCITYRGQHEVVRVRLVSFLSCAYTRCQRLVVVYSRIRLKIAMWQLFVEGFP